MIAKLRSSARDAVRAVFHQLGYDVVSYSAERSHELRRSKFLREHGVDLVLDGGANRGQYARLLRKLGYRGEIVSVEPIPAVFSELERAARKDPLWHCVSSALGERAGEASLHLNPISEVSSLLAATGSTHTEGWRSEETIRVPVRTVDELVAARAVPGRLFLKLDLQGYELPALAGAPRALACACGVELEASTVELYEGAALLPEVVARLDRLGFALFSAEPALVDHASGRVLQLDVLFARS